MHIFTKQLGMALLVAGGGLTIAASQINYNVPSQGREIPVSSIANKVVATRVNNPVVKSDTRANPKNEVKVKVISEGAAGGEVGYTPDGSVSSTRQYSFDAFISAGVVRWNGYKFTYYSQRILPGSGLQIPGRHVNADGYVCDDQGYIVLAGSAVKGTVYPTPFGAPGKIYDRGTSGNHLDVYIK